MSRKSKTTPLVVLTTIVGFVMLSCTAQQSGSIQQDCRAGQFTLSGDYPGAHLGVCRVLDANSILLINAPEDIPINNSPWYGFRIDGEPGKLEVSIRYSIHRHRYWPKFSTDNHMWARLPEEQVKISHNKRSVTLKLEISESPLWISAQENLTNRWYKDWIQDLHSQLPELQHKIIGKSLGGREIYAIQSDPALTNVLLLVGRQHPPEVTGALALRYFTDRLLDGRASNCLSESVLCHFFATTNIVIIPNLNPDGVELGHWRHGLGHLDLNRDWGPFTQPETKAVLYLIDGLIEEGKRITLFLDFHSTHKNLFYTQSNEDSTNPTQFANRWLNLAADRGVYQFTQEPRQNMGRPTSKNYIHARFGIPAITYEVGDETDRSLIQDSAVVFADTMIETFRQTRRIED